MYERYREGLIKRHICKDGRFLQQVLLVEQRAAAPHPSIGAIARVSEERTSNGSYRYEAFPVLLEGYHPEDGWISGKVVGGGDNPLLFGGLAMAFFAMEDLLKVSTHSYGYALRLLDYFNLTEGSGGPGWFKRKRHHWHPTKDISKDELCGLLLGLHFLHKAAKGRRDSHSLWRVNSLIAGVAAYLKARNYSPAGAWLFQFPFTRVFKYDIGNPYLCGRTFPSVPNMGYKPKHLYYDTMKWLRYAYMTAVLTNSRRNFFNVALYLYTSLMIHDNPVKPVVRNELWSAFKPFFQYFANRSSVPGSGAGSKNAFLGLMTRAVASKVGRDWEVAVQAARMYRSVISPQGIWCLDLPLCDLPHQDCGIAAAEPFKGKLWGECFTWQHSDEPHGHVLNWSWPKTVGSIGPDDLLLVVKDKKLNEVAETSKGFRVEGAGLGLLFVRILAAYFGFAPKPTLDRDKEHPVLPVDGPRPD